MTFFYYGCSALENAIRHTDMLFFIFTNLSIQYTILIYLIFWLTLYKWVLSHFYINTCEIYFGNAVFMKKNEYIQLTIQIWKKKELLITSVWSATNIKASVCAFESCIISIITKIHIESYFHCVWSITGEFNWTKMLSYSPTPQQWNLCCIAMLNTRWRVMEIKASAAGSRGRKELLEKVWISANQMLVNSEKLRDLEKQRKSKCTWDSRITRS